MRLTKTSAIKGFSLIELLVVISIIGVLAAVALPGYQAYAVKTRVAEMQRLALSLTVEQDAFYQEHGRFFGKDVAEQTKVPHSGGGFDGYHLYTDASGGNIGLVELYITEDLYEGANAGARFIYEGTADQFGRVSWNCVQHRETSLRPNNLEFIPEECHDVFTFY